MNMIYKIAKTELQMLFYSPVAWLVLIIFTFQSGMIFSGMIEMVEREQAMGYDPIFISSSLFGRLFYNVQDYLFLYIPLLTMGLVSRDLSGGTIKLLHSSPMTEHADYSGKISFHDDFCLVVGGDICPLRDLLLVRGGEFRYMVYSYRDSGYLFADMHVCLDRVVYVDDFFLPDYRGGGDVCTFDFLEFRERHLAGY